MLLRASSQITGTQIDLALVNGGDVSDGGIEQGARLLAFAEAVMGTDEAILRRERARLRALLSAEAFVDAAAVIGAFNVVDRVADATGIPLDPMMISMTADVRQQLNLGRFSSAANTPDA